MNHVSVPVLKKSVVNNSATTIKDLKISKNLKLIQNEIIFKFMS